jgi:hypothetical protein
MRSANFAKWDSEVYLVCGFFQAPQEEPAAPFIRRLGWSSRDVEVSQMSLN